MYCVLALEPHSLPCLQTKEALVKVTCSTPVILKNCCSCFEDFYWTIEWQSSTKAEAGQFQNDSSKNIHSPFVLLPSLALNTSALTHCHYPSMVTAPKGFSGAGSIYGFICSWVLGGKGLSLILTNSTFMSLIQKSYYYFYVFLSFIFFLFPFLG